MWSAEERAEGLEYMHSKPSSHSGRIVGYSSLVITSVARHPLSIQGQHQWSFRLPTIGLMRIEEARTTDAALVLVGNNKTSALQATAKKKQRAVEIVPSNVWSVPRKSLGENAAVLTPSRHR